MRRGLQSLTDAHSDCPDALFDALRAMAEGKLDTPVRSGKLL